MAYGLPRKNTVKTILRGSCYKVQEPWDLALLTKTWYTNIANIKLPFLGEITFGTPVQLVKCQIGKDDMLPSKESIRIEREYERKRLEKLKSQENAYEEIQLSLKEKKIGLRRPLSQVIPSKLCSFPVSSRVGKKGSDSSVVSSSVQTKACSLVHGSVLLNMG
uniref:uncharacterized protein C4orf36 homolog n=1 Tax=Jaculus jaculus TaxID=51337 RepID=UPI001E1B0089|nr:uncharacterized protein C4orf36 homolog [Jaculus jaculus]